nr:transport and Golgi organization protein 1 homolog [Cavia porcellus]
MPGREGGSHVAVRARPGVLVQRERFFAMDVVSATGLGVTVSRGFPKLLQPLQMLYAALETRLLRLAATLPEHVQPRPDFYGLPWKPVLFTACLGIVSLAIFFWRTVHVVTAPQQGSQAQPCSFTPCTWAHFLPLPEVQWL